MQLFLIRRMLSAEKFEEDYRYILTETKEKLNAQIILCEPFLTPINEEKILWREDLDPKIHKIRSLAREFGAIYIPFDGILAQACARKELTFWARDGVHPSAPSHALG